MASILLKMPAASLSGGDVVIDDSFEDACTICLEPFTSLDPPTVTKCKHDYHLHCILEWSQRSNECPICSQHLVLKDPVSQELLVAMSSDKILRFGRHFVDLDNEVNNRIMRQFPVIATRARSIRRRRQTTPSAEPLQNHPVSAVTNTSNARQLRELQERQNQTFRFSDIEPIASFRSPTVIRSDSLRRTTSSTLAPAFTAENSQFPVESSQWTPEDSGRSILSDFAAFAESLKSKISNASAKCKESISKSTRGLKEKLAARNDSVKELSRGIQRELSAGIAKVMERLDITQKRSGASVSKNSPLEAKGKRDDKTIIE